MSHFPSSGDGGNLSNWFYLKEYANEEKAKQLESMPAPVESLLFAPHLRDDLGDGGAHDGYVTK